jgi:hypothetical protein
VFFVLPQYACVLLAALQHLSQVWAVLEAHAERTEGCVVSQLVLTNNSVPLSAHLEAVLCLLVVLSYSNSRQGHVGRVSSVSAVPVV